MRIIFPRGDPQWGRYNNKGDCPPHGTPFWRVMNPFLLRIRDIYERALISESVASHPLIERFVGSTESGTLYATFGSDYPPLPRQVAGLRRRILEVLPDEVRRCVPEAIINKYLPRN